MRGDQAPLAIDGSSSGMHSSRDAKKGCTYRARAGLPDPGGAVAAWAGQDGHAVGGLAAGRPKKPASVGERVDGQITLDAARVCAHWVGRTGPRHGWRWRDRSRKSRCEVPAEWHGCTETENGPYSCSPIASRGPSGHREERRWGYFGGCLESAPRKRFPWAPPNLAAASRCGSRTTQAGAASASMGAALIAGSGADSLLFGLATSVVLRFVQSAYKNTMAVQSVKEDASSNPG
jgi:hypothetical protein